MGVAAGDLRATAFVLDQTPVRRRACRRPPTRSRRSARSARSRCPVADVEDLTGLDLGPLTGADVLAPVGALGDRERWVPLDALEEIRL